MAIEMAALTEDLRPDRSIRFRQIQKAPLRAAHCVMWSDWVR